MTLNNWFKKYAHTPLIALFSLSLVIYLSFLAFTYKSTGENQQKSFQDLILTTVQLGLQKNDRGLIESAMNRSVENLGAHYAFLCDNDNVLIRVAREIKSCAALPKATLSQRIITFDNFGFAGYSLHFYVTKFPIKTSHVLMLIFIFSIFLILSWITFNLRKHLLTDLIYPLQNNLLENKNLSILEFQNLKSQIEQNQSMKVKQAALQAESDSRRKFAHNVRSPLRVLKSLKNIIEQKLSSTELKLMSTGLDQIEELSEGLNREKEKITENFLTSMNSDKYEGELFCELKRTLREQIDTQKTLFLQNKENINVTLQHSGKSNSLAFLDKTEFKSIVSNLFTNAKEADATKIDITLNTTGESFEITFKNNGKPIPKEIKNEIFHQDFTYDKPKGTGYGLYHAKKYLNRWSGDIEVDNDSGQLTVFKITIPVSKVPSLPLNENTELLVMEDQDFEREFLVPYANKLRVKEKIRFFYNTDELDDYLSNPDTNPNYILLADNDVGEGYKTGLNYILDHKLQDKSYLITNSFGDSVVMSKAFKNDVRVIPKVLFI